MALLENLYFPSSFFEDEIREGFYVSSMMKRYWAAQLTVLAEIDRVCRRHGIQWQIDNGTLLGAVRHGGYIPWDDDMDISMLRTDYERFFAVAEDELPSEYRILTIKKESGYTEMLGRVTNTDKIDYSEDHLRKYHGCPYTVGIDIFPLDALACDVEEEESRRQKLVQISDTLGIINSEGVNSPKARIPLIDIERKNKVNLKKNSSLPHSLLLLSERIYMSFSMDEAEHVALMPYWVSKHNHKYPKSLFTDTILLRFENTFLPAPAIYDEVLRIEYGEYMEIHKDGGVHEYPVYKEQEEIYRRVKGEYPFRYTMKKDSKLSERDDEPLDEKCLEIADTLIQAHVQIDESVMAQDDDAFVGLLEGCQNVAIALGMLIEQRMPEREDIVHKLEEYCENIYQAGTKWDDEFHLCLDEKVKEIRAHLESALSNRKKEVLVLPCKPQWWPELASFCDQMCSKPDTEVYVMPIPYMVKDIFGAPDDAEVYKRSFPDSAIFVSEYDLMSRHPDMIVIQYPYDEFNTILTIPETYYSRNLLSYTDELVYVPWVQVGDPGEDVKAKAALRYIIEQPALVHADKTFVQTEGMRKLYVDTLTDMTGHREYWENKISVIDCGAQCTDRTDGMLVKSSKSKGNADHVSKNIQAGTCCMTQMTRKERRQLPAEWKVSEGKKLLLFVVSASFLIEYRENAIDKINEALDIILEAQDRITCVYSPHESISQLAAMDNELWKAYEKILERVQDDDRIIYDAEHKAGRYLYSFSGYYGNESDIVLKCVDSGVPVMLMRILEKESA